MKKKFKTAKPDYDLCVIGGGINGAGIARDAAGRGLSVLLVEARDLAGATSSASTKLIHGGLRYLENYEFGLVRHALAERERLLGLAPHIISPRRFVLPHDRNLRPAWLIRAGLFLYDRLGGPRHLPASRGLNLRRAPVGVPLQDRFKKGFSYSDCWVDDARLVVLNALDAAERGATILTRVTCTGLIAQGNNWLITLEDASSGRQRQVSAAQVVNAAGPWVRALLDESGLTGPDTPQIRLVKGSHIIVPLLFEGPQCYMLQQPDRRIVFAIPYERDYTLIGTTETEYHGAPDEAAIGPAEIDYLCRAINDAFKKQIQPADIKASYSGVRPLLDDGRQNARAVTRDYQLVLDRSFGPKLLSVFGGKITTYRLLAEEALDLLTGTRQHWTGSTKLPGGDIPGDDMPGYIKAQQARYDFLPDSLVARYARAYGTRLDLLLKNVNKLGDMGADYGGGLYEAELLYLIEHEWAKTPEDILWRRTKLGLHTGPETAYKLSKAALLQQDD